MIIRGGAKAWQYQREKFQKLEEIKDVLTYGN